MTLAERIFEKAKSLPDAKAAKVIDFIEALKELPTSKEAEARPDPWSLFAAYRGRYDGRFERDELYDR